MTAVPIMAIVFVSFLVIGISLPSLPLHVRDTLGFGPAVVGVIAGGQFCAALLSRFWAGNLADRRGARLAVELGLIAATLGGAFYIASVTVVSSPWLSTALLFIGRVFLGVAESLVITGGITWGLGRAAPEISGKVISWVGMSMFAAYALGGPVGGGLYTWGGFWSISVLTTIIPPLALVATRRIPGVKANGAKVGSALGVLRAVALPGVGFALSGITFGAMISFIVLYYSERNWSGEVVAFSTFAVALIMTRLIAGGLPDKFGGARVATCCLLIQASGLALVAFSPNMPLATFGVALAGIGFSLVFPGLGLEAMARASEEQRGLAMGTYNAFLDLTLGLGSPLLGLAGTTFGLSSVFVIAGVSALLAVPVSLRLKR